MNGVVVDEAVGEEVLIEDVVEWVDLEVQDH
jgi:hypothetical protein